MKRASSAAQAAIASFRAAPAEQQRRRAWLALAVAAHVVLSFVWRADFFHDATHVYLPHARRLLTEGWSFLGTEQSVWTPFLAYGFPALLGAHATTVMAVHLVLSSSVVVMVYAIGASAHSPRAGLCAAWIYAVSPAVTQIVINASTEIPFLFLCALWAWAFTRLEESNLRRYAWIAGVALALATNTRGSILPFVYVSALTAGLASLFSRPRRGTWVNLALVQGIAAGIVTLVIAKNWILFGLPQIATGGGNALYLGSHTLTGGYEPFYGGLFFDVGAVAQGTHLSIDAHRALGNAARQMIDAQPLAEAAANLWRRLGAFFFYANVVLEDSFFTLRSWRIVLLTLATVALAQVAMAKRPHHPVLLLVAAVMGVQVAVHLPVVYNPRYSEGSLELWLAILGGCGAAVVSTWPRRRLAILSIALALACFGGKSIRHLEGPVAPLRFSPGVPHRIAWQMPAPDTGPAVLAAARSSLRIDVPDVEGFAGNANYGRRNFFLLLDLATPEGAASCVKGRVAFVPATFAGRDVPESYYPFRLDARAAKQTFAFGIARATPTWKAPLNGAGTLTLSFNCDAGAAVRVDRLAIAEATFADAYGRDPASLPPPTPVPIVEYHHAGLGRYFITWVPEEIAALDAQAGSRGWTRTGETFHGFTLPTRERWPLCRFYVPPELGNAHFVGFGPAECEATERLNPRYLRESRDDPVYLHRPQDGRCPDGMRAVHRLRAGGGSPGQRLTTSAAIRDAMLAKGWIAGGANAGEATMCAPR